MKQFLESTGRSSVTDEPVGVSPYRLCSEMIETKLHALRAADTRN